MDQSLKARLIGAIVLVLFVVLVVPELLSGRKSGTTEPVGVSTGDGQTRTYTIELGKGVAPAPADTNATRPIAPESSPLATERPTVRDASGSTPPRTTSSPAREAKVAATTQQPERATPERSAAPPARDATPEPTAADMPARARGTWSVQVGAFGSAESARRLVQTLESDGFRAYVSPVELNGKTLHRVRVGPEAARPQADALAGRLKARGLPVSLVAND